MPAVEMPTPAKAARAHICALAGRHCVLRHDMPAHMPVHSLEKMAVETLGKYQLEFEPFELSGTHRWVAYLSIHKFDDAMQDFVCVVKERRIATEGGFASAAEAVEEARRVGNALIRAGRA